jgi:hypothetical protein
MAVCSSLIPIRPRNWSHKELFKLPYDETHNPELIFNVFSFIFSKYKLLFMYSTFCIWGAEADHKYRLFYSHLQYFCHILHKGLNNSQYKDYSCVNSAVVIYYLHFNNFLCTLLSLHIMLHSMQHLLSCLC